MREIHCKKRGSTREPLLLAAALMLGLCVFAPGPLPAEDEAAAASNGADAPAASVPAPTFTLTPEPGVTSRIYRVGETITFSLRRRPALGDIPPVAVHYRIEENGLEVLQEGAMPPEEKDREVLALPRKPGFILVRAWEIPAGTPPEPPVDPDNLPPGIPELQAGAAVAPDELPSSGEAPVDFDEFWAGKLEALKEVPLEVLEMTPVESGRPEILAWDIKVAAPGGKPVSGYLARPLEVQPRSLPALVIYQGAGVRSAELDLAVNGASWGALCLQVNAHGILNGQPPEYYEELRLGAYDNYPRRNMKDRDGIYFGGMFLRAVRALEFMEAQPAWDGKALIVGGQSQGAAQALAAAALHPRVSAVFAAIPALCDLSALDAGRRPGWPFQKYTADKAPPPAFAYFDTVHMAGRVRVPALYAVGLMDRIAPPSSGYRAYLMHAGPKRMLLMGDAGHIVSVEAWKAYEEFVTSQFKPTPPASGHAPDPPTVNFTVADAVPPS